MLKKRMAAERGHADHGWLKAAHTFSFAGFHDPSHMGFGSLRVMNEDQIAPGRGFGTHAHDNMEIVTYVLEGALEHKDSMGNGEVLRPGEFQRISAGTGITHSEFNPSSEEPTHLYQIWLKPAQTGIAPSYEQKKFDRAERRNRLQLVASPGGDRGSLQIHQDARIYLADICDSQSISFAQDSDRNVWIQVLKGNLAVNEVSLSAGDGLASVGEPQLSFEAASQSEIMLFDLA